MAATVTRTVSAPATAEVDKVKGSRFIGDVSPAGSEAAALAFVQVIRDREPSASHHCWAFRLADGRERSSDDGEPGGTGGPPILQRIAGANVADVVVVVTRYYGGTNLGTGGLIRAYGGCAAAVLSVTDIVTTPLVTRLDLRHPYELSGPVEGVLAAHAAVTIDVVYAADVALQVAVPQASEGAFVAAMTEATAGRVVPCPAPTVDVCPIDHN